MKSLVKNLLFNSGVFRLARLLRDGDLVIFNYHRIRGEAGEAAFDDGVFGPTAVKFREEMSWLKRHTRILSEGELVDAVKSGKRLGGISTMVTFDDGYRDNYDLAYPILRDLKIPAIFFIPTGHIESRELGWWDIAAYLVKRTKLKQFSFRGKQYDLNEGAPPVIGALVESLKLLPSVEVPGFLAELSAACDVPMPARELQDRELMTWEQIREVSSHGITIGSHTHSHRILSRQDLDGQREDLRLSKEILEKKLGSPVRSLAYPVGGYEHFHLETKDLAREAGYDLAFSFLTGINQFGKMDPYDVRRVDIQPQWPNLDYPLAFPDRAFRRPGALKQPLKYERSAKSS